MEKNLDKKMTPCYSEQILPVKDIAYEYMHRIGIILWKVHNTA